MSVASTPPPAAPPSPAPPSPAAAPAANPLHWQGFLGKLRRQPVMSGAILILCTGIIAASGWFIVYPELAIYYRIKQAQKAADNYDLDSARRQFDLALKHSPKSGELHFLQARVCRRAGDYVAARQHLQKAKEDNWDSDDLELEFMLVQALTGAIRVVEKNLQSYIGVGKRDEIFVLEAMVLAYYGSNFLDDAHHWVQYWIKHYPDMWRPQYLCGMILERGLKPMKAAEQYEQLLAWKADAYDARLQLARIHLRAKLYEEAKVHYDLFLRGRPNQPDGAVGLATCLRQLQQAEAALPLLDETIRTHPQHAPAHLLRGVILMNDLNRPQEAVESLRKADQFAPNDLETVGSLAKAYRELGRDQEAQVYEEKSRVLETAFRHMDKLIKEIIETDQKKRNSAEARRRSVELRHEAGLTLLKAGRKEEAVAWLVGALQDDPEHRPSLEVLREHMNKEQGRKAP